MRHLSRRLAILAALCLCHGTVACVFTQEPSTPSTSRDMGADQGAPSDMTTSDMPVNDMTTPDMPVTGDMSGDMPADDMGADMACPEPCAEGTKRCSEDGLAIEECSRAGDCLRFTTTTQCEDDQSCEQGMADRIACVAPGPCKDVPALTRCGPEVRTTCKPNTTNVMLTCPGADPTAPDVCPTWQEQACPADQVCDAAAGKCVCQDQCQQAGSMVCNADGHIQTCEQGADGCLVLSVPVICLDGKTCRVDANNQARCLLPCERECDPADVGRGVCLGAVGKYQICEYNAQLQCHQMVEHACRDVSRLDSYVEQVACSISGPNNMIECRDTTGVATNPEPTCHVVSCPSCNASTGQLTCG